MKHRMGLLKAIYQILYSFCHGHLGCIAGIFLLLDNSCGVNIGGGTRGAGGATAPPDLKIYTFGPPRFQNQKLTNIGLLVCIKCNLKESFC